METVGTFEILGYSSELKFIIMAKSKETLKLEFIAKAKTKFGDKFDYSKVDYITSRTPVIIICPEHGEFTMNPSSHLNSPTGCKECSKHVPRKKAKLVDGQNRKEMREYRIWKALRSRAHDYNRPDAKYYADKGITVCERWDSFENFYEDMGPCPEGGSIDRIDSNGNYCPENCRWANMTIQSQNREDFNDVIEYNGETHVLKEWSRILGINYTTLRNRIYRGGLSFEEAIREDPYHRLIEYKGEKHTLKEWCELKNMEYDVVINRLSKHKWSFEDAIEIPKGGRRKKKSEDIV